MKELTLRADLEDYALGHNFHSIHWHASILVNGLLEDRRWLRQVKINVEGLPSMLDSDLNEAHDLVWLWRKISCFVFDLLPTSPFVNIDMAI